MKTKNVMIDGVNLGIYEPCFQMDGHIYHCPAGIPLDSVTTILKYELGLYQWGTTLPAEKGHDIHKAIQYHTQGILDEKNLAPEYKARLDTFKLAVESERIVVLASEVMRYHPTFLFAGTIDIVGTVDDVPSVIDIKTGAPCVWHRWQVATYERLLRLQDGIERQRYDLYLKDGSYKFTKHEGKSDWSEFLTMCMAHKIKVANGYREITANGGIK